MTEQLDTGVNVGNENQVDSNAGNKKVVDNKPTVEELQSLLEQERKASSSKDKSYSDAMAKLKAIEEEQERDRQAKLSTEDKLKELEAQIQADKEEKALINAATSKGLNLSQARELVQKVKSGDFDGMAGLIGTMLDDVKTTTSQEVEEKVKSSIVTSSAPDIKQDNEDPALLAFRKGMGRA